MEKLITKTKKIKLVIFDIDGVLTDGRLYFSNQDDFTLAFHIQDGLGINLLHRAGIEVALMSGRQSKSVLIRAGELNIKHIYLGCKDKQKTYIELKEKLNLDNENIAYVGDDWIDLAPLQMAGVKFTVPNAVDEIKAIADWFPQRQGGEGAVRDICIFILKAQEKYETLLQEYSMSS